MNMLSGAKYLKDGHPVMVDKDGGYEIYKIYTLPLILINSFFEIKNFSRWFNGICGTYEFFAWISSRGISQ